MSAATETSYRDQVARVLAGQEAEPMFNGTTDHACVVVEEAFKAARHNVRLLTRSLDTSCYGKEGVISAARGFLAQGGQLTILVETAAAAENVSHPFLQALATYAAQIELRVVPASVVERYKYNFLVVDDVSFRFEEDRREHIATVAGGDKHIVATRNLAGVFDGLRQLSALRPLPVAA